MTIQRKGRCFFVGKQFTLFFVILLLIASMTTA